MERNLQGNRDSEGNLKTVEEPVELSGDEKVEALIKDLYDAEAEDVQAILDKHNVTAEDALDIYPIGEEMEESNKEAYDTLRKLVSQNVEVSKQISEPKHFTKPAPEGMLKE